jgi:hypothetical protein
MSAALGMASDVALAVERACRAQKVWLTRLVSIAHWVELFEIELAL